VVAVVGVVMVVVLLTDLLLSTKEVRRLKNESDQIFWSLKWNER
jgi:hypothetical protein